VMDQQASDPGQRAAHRLLAEELTGRVHGADTARRVVAASRLLFGGQDLRAAEATVFQTLADEIPTLRMARAELEGLPVIDLLVKAGLATSKSDADGAFRGRDFPSTPSR
jgi:Tyrosyl-tRNA synthetase